MTPAEEVSLAEKVAGLSADVKNTKTDVMEIKSDVKDLAKDVRKALAGKADKTRVDRIEARLWATAGSLVVLLLGILGYFIVPHLLP